MTLAEHRARLEAQLEALVADNRKPVQIVAILRRYIRTYALPAAVARFEDGTVQIVWSE